MKKILVILGTRPEAIKLAPVILELRKSYKVLVCNTEQQKELSNQALGFFGILADFNLNIMQDNQGLCDTQARILNAIVDIFKTAKIDACVVQGDTLSAFCGALASFYNKIPLFYVESGLRSYDLFEPYPEEALRQMIARIATLHFAPTDSTKRALIKENINKNIFVVGNTGIDALFSLNKEAILDAEKFLESLHTHTHTIRLSLLQHIGGKITERG